MDENMPLALERFLEKHLSTDERREIVTQLATRCRAGRQVLWTGMERNEAQTWADRNDMQTLTTAMGHLMNTEHPRCPRRNMTDTKWPEYVHGASALFAWYISKGDLVTVLLNPPPQRFHPSGKTSFQTIEEPILKGKLGNRPVGKIQVIHPSIPGASTQPYQIWPHDEVSRWQSTFHISQPVSKWRQVKSRKEPCGFRLICSEGVAAPKDPPLIKMSKKHQKTLSHELGEKQKAERKSPHAQHHEEQAAMAKRFKRERKMLHQKHVEESTLLRRKHNLETRNLDSKWADKTALTGKSREIMQGSEEMGDCSGDNQPYESVLAQMWKYLVLWNFSSGGVFKSRSDSIRSEFLIQSHNSSNSEKHTGNVETQPLKE